MKRVYIFDVDGVINNLHTYEYDGRVIRQIGELLNRGDIVAFNTGRGYGWVEENVLARLKKDITSPKSLDRVFVSAEMGGVTVEFKDGVELENHTAFSLLPEQIEAVREFFAREGIKELMSPDLSKVSMATVFKPASAGLDEFADCAGQLVTKLRKEFADQRIKVSHTADAIDVTTPESGKWAGAQLIHDWLAGKSAIEGSHFTCFGDNTPDYEMARFFCAQGHTVDFVFTGKSLGEVEHDPRVVLHKTAEPYSNGTYEYLSHLVPEKESV